MKRFSRNISIIAIVFFATMIFADQIQAQSGRGARGSMVPDSTQIVQMTEDLAKAINLTPAQKTQISALHFDHFAEVRKLRTKHQGDRETMWKAGKEMREKMDTEIKALLNDEQKKAYEKYVAERRVRPGSRGRWRKNY